MQPAFKVVDVQAKALPRALTVARQTTRHGRKRMSNSSGKVSRRSSLLSRRTFCESGGRIGAGLLGAYILPGIVAKARAAEPLTIGWIRPTTGLYASSYAPLYLGGRIAMDEINAAGGILGRQLVVREEDDEAAPSKEPAVARKLQDAGVEFVLGPTGSAQVLASLPVMTS